MARGQFAIARLLVIAVFLPGLIVPVASAQDAATPASGQPITSDHAEEARRQIEEHYPIEPAQNENGT